MNHNTGRRSRRDIFILLVTVFSLVFIYGVMMMPVSGENVTETGEEIGLEETVAAPEPEDTIEPDETDAPVEDDSPEPENTVEPEETDAPIEDDSPEPEDTVEPDETDVPIEDDSSEPEDTVTPDETVTPDATDSPEPTVSPEDTVTPDETVTPVETDSPEPTVSPEDTVTPDATDSPEPTVSPEDTVTPDETVTPDATDSPEPTVSPEDTVTPVDTATPEPTGTQDGNLTSSDSSSDGDTVLSVSQEDGTSDDNSEEIGVVTLGEVIVTAAPDGWTALVAGHTGDDYDFVGSYGYSGNNYVVIKESGSYYLTGDLTTTHSFAIQITGSGVTLDGRDLADGNDQNTVDGHNSGVGVEIASTADHATVQNMDITSTGTGINSSADYVTITDNTIRDSDSDPSYGIKSTGLHAVISGNTLENLGDTCDGSYLLGIYSSGDDATISDNSITGLFAGNEGTLIAIYSIGENALIIDNTESGFEADDSKFGLYLEGSATVTGNEITEILWIMDSSVVEVTGNTIDKVYIDVDGGTGSGSIYNNYIGSSSVTSYNNGKVGRYTWTNPNGPEEGTNIMGGPNIAGNYWEGWSNTKPVNPSGYTTTRHQVATGEDIRIPAGDPVQFTVTVGTDGTVTVTSP